MMKAAVRSYGGSIYFSDNYKKPTCGPNQILVKVKAAGINPVDYKMPYIMAGALVGFDLAGE